MKLKVVAIVLLLAVGGAAVLVAMGGLPRSAAAATSYLTAPAIVTDVTDDVAATGAVAAATSWDLRFGAAPALSSDDATAPTDTGTWTVTDVSVRVGDQVAAGQVLATATNSSLDAAIAAAHNDVTAANLQLLLARDQYDDASGTAATRQARMGLLNATNAYAKAKQDLVDLQQEAARRTLVAPAAGTVTAVHVAKGIDAPAGAAITIDGTSYQVTADVVEDDVPSISIGQAAAVSVAAVGADLSGTVAEIAPTAADTASANGVVSYAVTITLASPPKTLRSGMTADITVTTASAKGVLAVPVAAIRGTAGSYSVLVLADGAPQVRAVTVGLMTSGLVEIKSGLSEGEQVITGTSSQQRSGTTNTFGPGGGGFVVPGGGRGGNANGPIIETKP